MAVGWVSFSKTGKDAVRNPLPVERLTCDLLVLWPVQILRNWWPDVVDDVIKSLRKGFEDRQKTLILQVKFDGLLPSDLKHHALIFRSPAAVHHVPGRFRVDGFNNQLQYFFIAAVFQ